MWPCRGSAPVSRGTPFRLASPASPRPAQELEALTLTLLKDVRSDIYKKTTQIREVVVHEYQPPRRPAPPGSTTPASPPLATTSGRPVAASTPAPTTHSVSTPASPPRPASFVKRPATADHGEIEVDEARAGPRRLEVTAVRARHLPKMDNFGTIDGYCVITFNDASSGEKTHKTSTVKNTYSPDWNEAFTFEVDDVSKRPKEGVKVVVMDWDRLSADERVGEVSLSADRVWDVLRTRDNWVEEKEFFIMDGGKQVVARERGKGEEGGDRLVLRVGVRPDPARSGSLKRRR